MDFRAALLEQTRAFGDLIRSGDPATPVPTCGEWTLRQLSRHVGRGSHWAAQIVAERRIEPLDPRDVRNGRPPDDPDAAIDWLNDGAQALIDAVDRVGADARVWTFLGPRPAGFWLRRWLHEVTVHRADAALALGREFDLPPESAADAGSEWIELVASRQSHNHAKGDAAVRGPVTGLLLALTRRRTAADLGVDVLGDADVWDRWLERTPF